MPITSPRRLNSGPPELTRVDRHVGLDEGHEVLIRQAATLGTDDACGHRLLESERRAYRQHPFADRQGLGVAEHHMRQAARLDADQRDVAARIGANDGSVILALVGQTHHDAFGLLDDVGVGENVAVVADDEARAERFVVRLRTRIVGHARHEATEEIEHRVRLVELGRAEGLFLRRGTDLRGADVDHRRALTGHQAREVGQCLQAGSA